MNRIAGQGHLVELRKVERRLSCIFSFCSSTPLFIFVVPKNKYYFLPNFLFFSLIFFQTKHILRPLFYHCQSLGKFVPCLNPPFFIDLSPTSQPCSCRAVGFVEASLCGSSLSGYFLKLHLDARSRLHYSLKLHLQSWFLSLALFC